MRRASMGLAVALALLAACGAPTRGPVDAGKCTVIVVAGVDAGAALKNPGF